jgi:AcrR family transcriptional regulator
MNAAAVSGGALHHHFSTKQSLALAVFEERVAPAVRETWIDPVRTADSFGQGVRGDEHLSTFFVDDADSTVDSADRGKRRRSKNGPSALPVGTLTTGLRSAQFPAERVRPGASSDAP